MTKLYAATMINTGGRSGEIHSPDQSFSLKVLPPSKATENATNPEQLFAAGYSACFGSALSSVMMQEGVKVGFTVTVTVSLYKKEPHNYSLGVDIMGHVDEVSKEKAEVLLEKAHLICPYSKAIQGNVEVAISAV